MRNTVILIVLASVFVVGCDSDAIEEEARVLECIQKPIPGVLQPLEVGNKWVYEKLNSSGVSSVQRYEVTERIQHPFRPDDYAYVLTYTVDGRPEINSKEIKANGPLGLELIERYNDNPADRYYFLTYPYPTSRGHTFYQMHRDSLTNPGQISIVNGLEYQVFADSYSTPTDLGPFTTIVYERKQFIAGDAPDGPLFYHFAPGIGFIVKDWNRLQTPTSVFASLRLVDYCLMQ